MAKRLNRIQPWWTEDIRPLLRGVRHERQTSSQPRILRFLHDQDLYLATLAVAGERLDAIDLRDIRTFPTGTIIRVETASQSITFFEVVGVNSVFMWRCAPSYGGRIMGPRNIEGAVIRRGQAIRYLDPHAGNPGTSRVEDLALVLKGTEPLEVLVSTPIAPKQ